jgi:hypothetical protein
LAWGLMKMMLLLLFGFFATLSTVVLPDAI